MGITFEEMLFNPDRFTAETIASKDFMAQDGIRVVRATLRLSKVTKTGEIIDCCSYYGVVGAGADKRAVSYAEALRLAEEMSSVISLSDLRKVAGLTQAQVASAAGTGLRYYQSLEGGERLLSSCSLELATKLAAALGITLDGLAKIAQ